MSYRARVDRALRLARARKPEIDWRAVRDRVVSRGEPLTPRWTPLDHVAEQARLRDSPARIKWIAAGRRSGKTENAKRGVDEGPWPAGVLGALHDPIGGYWVYGAPTRDQAKRLFWRDLKRLVPSWAKAGPPSESELVIPLRSGAFIMVAGLDVPERLEGIAIRWAGIDEFAKVKPTAWYESLYPALTTRDQEGGAWLFGRPKGRNHFWDCWSAAKISAAAARAEGREPDEDAFHWTSSEVLPAATIEAARRRLPAKVFREEYEASWETNQGLVYYAFDRDVHAAARIPYDPGRPLIVALDFNVRPGVAVLMQELPREALPAPPASREHSPWVTCVVGEVWIEEDSNTELVCEEILRMLGEGGSLPNPPAVHVYGDASGGARSTTSRYSDWQIVEMVLGRALGERLDILRSHSNPDPRERVNAFNGRIRSTTGIVGFLVDPVSAPHIITDLEGTEWKQTVNGDEIAKPAGTLLTHMTDAAGYYIFAEHPLEDPSGGRLVLT